MTIKARIFKSAKREFECRISSTKETVMAKALGNLLKNEESLVVGDYVSLNFDETNREYTIVDVEKRTSEIYRLLVRESKRKVTAANCQDLIILNSVSKPEYKRGFIDRFLIRAYQWEIAPLVIFNKMDQYNPEEFDICFEEKRLEALGVQCFEISALNPDYKPRFLSKGFEDLKLAIKGRTALFVGQSGVGKSRTISALSDGEFALKTQNVGKAGKGTHTTTWSEILEFGDFSLIDSPGIRSFSLDDIPKEDVLCLCPDLAEIAALCKFTNCSHLPESKGCAFYTQYDSEKDKAVFSRLDSYLRILEEISQTPDWKKNDLW